MYSNSKSIAQTAILKIWESKILSYVYHVKQNSSLADPVMCCYGQEAKNCYYKVKSLRNPRQTERRLTFGVPRGNHLTS